MLSIIVWNFRKVKLSAVLLKITFLLCHANSHYVEHHYSEYHIFTWLFLLSFWSKSYLYILMLIVIMLSVLILNVTFVHGYSYFHSDQSHIYTLWCWLSLSWMSLSRLLHFYTVIAIMLKITPTHCDADCHYAVCVIILNLLVILIAILLKITVKHLSLCWVSLS